MSHVTFINASCYTYKRSWCERLTKQNKKKSAMQTHGASSIELTKCVFFWSQEHKDGGTPDEKKMKTLLAARRKLMAQLIIELTNV